MLLARAESGPHMPGVESGMFLPNGGRFYVDLSHPEWASPECTNPWDAVRHGLAGDLFLSRLAADLVRKNTLVADLAVRKGNIDYLSKVTWGNHENYLLRRNPRAVRPGLVSHLVTRIVMTGAGGFDPFDTRCPSFVLSPRALFLRRGIGSRRGASSPSWTSGTSITARASIGGT
jgi:proteasome accessory factor A